MRVLFIFFVVGCVDCDQLSEYERQIQKNTRLITSEQNNAQRAFAYDQRAIAYAQNEIIEKAKANKVSISLELLEQLK